jgi:hypothetical protein
VAAQYIYTVLRAIAYVPEEMEMSTAMTVLMHSYSSDIAEVEWIRFVRGSISFLPNL